MGIVFWIVGLMVVGSLVGTSEDNTQLHAWIMILMGVGVAGFIGNATSSQPTETRDDE